MASRLLDQGVTQERQMILMKTSDSAKRRSRKDVQTIKAVETQINQHKEIEVDEVNVDAKSGRVVLSGVIDNNLARNLVQHIVETEVDKAKAVENKIEAK